jgi:hypothetical protein
MLFLALVSALLVATVPDTAQAAQEAPVIINALGGNAGDPGLRIHYANGQLQVFRNGIAQMYGGSTPTSPSSPGALDNTIALHMDGVAYSAAADWFVGIRFATTQSGGSASGSGSIVGTLDTGVVGFVIDVTIAYAYPDDYFTITLAVEHGATTLPLKLYHYLFPTAKNGAGFYLPSPQTVGVSQAGAFEAFRHVDGPAWTSYYGGDSTYPWFFILRGHNLNNAILVNPWPAKSIGIGWNLGTAAGTETVSYQMIFSDGVPTAPAQMLAPTSVAGNGSATVSITPPVATGFPVTGYIVTGDPGGATCSIAPSDISCVVSGLANGTDYSFSAMASNAYGVSAASPPSNIVTPASLGDSDLTTPIVHAFIDINDGDMATAASWLANQGIILGCEAGESPKFCPSDLATRAEVATFMTRALSLPATTLDAFVDDNGHLLEDNINRAAAAGLFLGCSDDLICPDHLISRGELAAVLVRALDLLSSTPSTFGDIHGHWAEAFIATIGGLGITNGCSADGQSFCPDTFGTRGEIALLLYRALTLE